MSKGKKEQWEAYCKQHLQAITPLLIDEGFELESDQPHIQGERYILSGEKLVLLGRQKNTDKRVVIKITNNADIARELEREQTAHEILNRLRFAYQTFHSPKEILLGRRELYTFYVTEFVPQDKTFLERDLVEQFFLALKALEAQEGSHATTYGHMKDVRNIFEVYDGARYVAQAREYKKKASDLLPKEYVPTLELTENAVNTLAANIENLDLYSGFLTHWDFVPHNIRIHQRNIYLLDHTAIRFGNKYESWARFMNFMTLHNQSLERALHEYVEKNRNESELKALHLMRIFRLLDLIQFYAGKLEEAEGNLETLTKKRVALWSHVLEAQLNNKPVSSEIVEVYKKERDSLRDTDEQERQVNLH